MLTMLRLLFAIITMVLAVFGLITKNFDYQAYAFLFLGLMALVMGIQEMQKKKKMMGWFSFIASVFFLYVAIQSFIYL